MYPDDSLQDTVRVKLDILWYLSCTSACQKHHPFNAGKQNGGLENIVCISLKDIHFCNSFENRVPCLRGTSWRRDQVPHMWNLILSPDCLQYYTSTLKSRYLEVDGTIFYKFKLPEVQINLHFGLFGLVKKSPTPNYGWRKQSKCIFDSDRRFDFRRIRDIRVRCIESRL